MAPAPRTAQAPAAPNSSAIALAAGTQAFTEGIGSAAFGSGVLRADLAEGAGWVINLAVAEYIIRRPYRRSRSTAKAAT